MTEELYPMSLYKKNMDMREKQEFTQNEEDVDKRQQHPDSRFMDGTKSVVWCHYNDAYYH